MRVSLSQLPTGTRYLALTVHNYTRQPMDECCADASVFVASTAPGIGPGGLDIISSAAMKGKGTNVLCGVLHLAMVWVSTDDGRIATAGCRAS